MSDSELSSGPWELMDPWWQILDAHNVQPRFNYAERATVSGIEVSLELHTLSARTRSQQCQALRDALELVFLSSVVDREAFTQCFLHYLPGEYLRAALPCEGDEFPCRVVIPINTIHPLAPTLMRTVLTALLTPTGLRRRDQAYQDTRALLVTSDASAVYKKLNITVTVCGFEWARELASVIRAQTPPAVDNPFRAVLLSLSDFPAVSKQHLDDVVACLRDPHRRVSLDSLIVRDMPEADEDTYGGILSALLSTPQVETLPPFAVDLRTPRDHRLATQACSAVMYARCIKSLDIDWTLRERLSQRDRTQLKRWILVSLFSHQARHSIQEVRLNRFHVDDADMDNLELLLLSENPLGALRGDYGQVEEAPPCTSQVFLTKGTNLLLNPVGTRRVAMSKWMTVRLENDCWADILANNANDGGCDPEHYEVVVPGYGLCGVRQSDTQSQRSLAQPGDGSQPPSHEIQSLTLRWSSERGGRFQSDNSGLQRFLRLVGSPLLTLAVYGVQDFTLCLDTVWVACPMLVRLEVFDVGSDILRRIGDAYESGKCRMSSLAVLGIKRPNGSQDIVDFCEKLCNPELLISRAVVDLALGTNLYRTRDTTAQEMESMLKMLQSNERLVGFSTSVRRLYHPTPMGPRLAAYNNQPVRGRGHPLALRAKLAFLSTAESKSNCEGNQARSLLGSDVIARIFEMAARPMMRRVLLTDAI